MIALLLKDTVDTTSHTEAAVLPTTKSSESKQKLADDNDNNNEDDDQMMFIFGPKLFSQLRQIKDMEDE
ncbi:unnamed protein product, partial [Rotaria socialis]